MSEFRRRLLIKNAKGGIKLPTYDKATYPYNALVYGVYIPDTAKLCGFDKGYSFVASTKKHTVWGKAGKPYNYLWKGGGSSSRAVTWVSKDGKNWTLVNMTNVTAQTYVIELEKVLFDNILQK